MTGIRSVASGRDGGSGLIAFEPNGGPAHVPVEQRVEPGRALLGGERVQRGDLVGRQCASQSPGRGS